MSANRHYKIVYCIPALYSAGGVERVVSMKASYFADVFDYDVTIIVTERKEKPPFFPLSEKVKVINLDLNFEELWGVSFYKKAFLYLIKQQRFKKLLSDALMRIRPDFTISVLRREINFINSIKDGSYKIGELHVNRANYRNFKVKGNNPFLRVFSYFWMNRLLKHLKQLDKFVVLTEIARNDWPELKDVKVIPDPLPYHSDKRSSLSEKRVISIGRYVYEKGNDLLLEAWSKVEKRKPDWSLDIYGMGNRDPYETQKAQLGIDPQRCSLHGFLKEVNHEYLSSSIFVLPSRFEGFGLVLIEAMAHGLPVLSFDCENGPRSIISDGLNGFLIPPFNVDMLSEKMILLMDNMDMRKRIGLNAYNESLKYDMDHIGLLWKQLFDSLINRNEV